MTPYEIGFRSGEQAAWDDRQTMHKQQPPVQIHTERERGFWDGYQPRDAMWSARPDARPEWRRAA